MRSAGLRGPPLPAVRTRRERPALQLVLTQDAVAVRVDPQGRLLLEELDQHGVLRVRRADGRMATRRTWARTHW